MDEPNFMKSGAEGSDKQKRAEPSAPPLLLERLDDVYLITIITRVSKHGRDIRSAVLLWLDLPTGMVR